MNWDGIIEDNYGFTGTLRLYKRDENGNKEYVDASGYDTYNFVFKSPAGTTKIVAAAVTTDGTDGRISAIVPQNTIDVYGQWRVAVQLIKTGADIVSTDLKFKVGRRATGA